MPRDCGFRYGRLAAAPDDDAGGGSSIDQGGGKRRGLVFQNAGRIISRQLSTILPTGHLLIIKPSTTGLMHCNMIRAKRETALRRPCEK